MLTFNIKTARPPILYKYYSPKRVDFFEDLSVRFSRPDTFNDVFDINWSIPDKTGRRDLFALRNTLGVFCTTSDPTNHLMWVHYAEEHKGFAIGFNSNAALFSDGGAELRKVQYDPPPTTLVPPARELCWFKDPHWNYEKEWRCIRNFTLKDSRDIGLEPEAIHEIVLGAKMSNGDITTILEMVHLLKPEYDIPVMVSKFDKAAHDITNVPSTLSYCTRCNGKGHFRS